jgi:hypothetical protein
MGLNPGGWGAKGKPVEGCGQEGGTVMCSQQSGGSKWFAGNLLTLDLADSSMPLRTYICVNHV